MHFFTHIQKDFLQSTKSDSPWIVKLSYFNHPNKGFSKVKYPKASGKKLMTFTQTNVTTSMVNW